MTAHGPALRPHLLRGVGGVEATIGALVLARPAELLHALRDGASSPTAVVVVARILGARMLAQGAMTVAAPGRRAGLGGAATDLSHALSMVPLAARVPGYRRPALVSAAVATVLAAAQLAATRRKAPQAAPRERP